MATVDRINGLTGNLGIKAPVRVATTANITLSGLQTIDGVTVVANDRVLVKDQTTQTQNGIYLVSATAWVREPDFDGSRDIVKGTLVRVNEGTVAAGRAYAVTASDPIVVGTSNITFTATVAGTDLGTAAYEDIGTSGANIGLLSANKTDSGTNTFTGQNTFENNVTVSAATPRIIITESDATANEGRTVIAAASDKLIIGTASDASTSIVDVILETERTGTTLDVVRMPNGVNPNESSGNSITNFVVGSYTPSLTNTTNITGSTAFTTYYMRINNYVLVFGRVNIDATTTGAIELNMEVPITTNFTSTVQAGGAANCTAVNQHLGITAEGTLETLSFRGVVTDTANNQYQFNAWYLIS